MLPFLAASQMEISGGFAMAAGSFGGNSGRVTLAAGSTGFGFGAGFAGNSGAGLADFSSTGGSDLPHPAARIAAITAVSLAVICRMDGDCCKLI
jgi:hypothetical protein